MFHFPLYETYALHIFELLVEIMTHILVNAKTVTNLQTFLMADNYLFILHTHTGEYNGNKRLTQ